MDLTLTAVFEEVPASEGGGFVAYTEELPGAITQGDSREEARENLRDAIRILTNDGFEAAWRELWPE
jgi:predicted RNase H-like HicB family nuclease